MIAPGSTARAEWRRYWTLPFASLIGYSTAALHTYGIGAFIEPLSQEFGWSRAEITGGLSIAGALAVACSVPIGMLVDRIGPRSIALVGVPLMTCAFALLGTATGTATNWYLLWGLIAFANLWLQTTVWTSAVATRFEASRGLAFGLTFSGGSVSQIVFPVLGTALIQAYGWRTAFVAMGVGWALLVFPILFFFFRGARDVPRGAKAPVQTDPEIALTGVGVAEGFRSLVLYKLLVAGTLFSFAALGIIVHFVPIMREQGAAPLGAAATASVIGVFSFIGRLGTGFLLDRLPGRLVGVGVFLLPVITCLLLLLDGGNPAVRTFAAAIFGFSIGAEVDIVGYLASRYFGLKNFGVFMGAIVGALALGLAGGPLAAGALYDWTGSYAAFLMLTIACMAISVVALATLGKPPFAPGQDRPS